MPLYRWVLFIFMWLPLHSNAQSYIACQHTFNRVDDDILSGHPGRSPARLDSIYNNYSFIYAKHCFKALQIMCALNDSARAGQWLSRCFLQGIPLWAIHTNELTRESLTYRTGVYPLQHYDSLKQVYRSRINTTLRAEIAKLLAIDYRYTRRVNNGFFLFRHTLYGLQWKRNNVREFKKLVTLIDQYGYPGEQLIGLPVSLEDSAGSVRFVLSGGGFGLELQNREVLFMLLHYYSNPRPDINKKLMHYIDNGLLPADHYGRINDYLAEFGKGRHGKYLPYHIHHDRPENSSGDIDERRLAIGLNRYEAQQRNRAIVRGRLQQRTINKEIIPE